MFSLCAELVTANRMESLKETATILFSHEAWARLLSTRIVFHRDTVKLFLLSHFLPRILEASELVTRRLWSKCFVNVVSLLPWHDYGAGWKEEMAQGLWSLAACLTQNSNPAVGDSAVGQFAQEQMTEPIGNEDPVHQEVFAGDSWVISAEALDCAVRIAQDANAKIISLKGLLLIYMKQGRLQQVLDELESFHKEHGIDISSCAFIGFVAASRMKNEALAKSFVLSLFSEKSVAADSLPIEDLLVLAKELMNFEDKDFIYAALDTVVNILSQAEGQQHQLLTIIRWLIETRLQIHEELTVALVSANAIWLLRMLKIAKAAAASIELTTQTNKIALWFRDVTFNLALLLGSSERYSAELGENACLKLRHCCSLLYYSEEFERCLLAGDSDAISGELFDCLLLHAGTKLQLGRLGTDNSALEDLLSAWLCASELSKAEDADGRVGAKPGLLLNHCTSADHFGDDCGI
eukprot:Gregarina_sp_Poly_1__8383@NODE_491_length_7964_cov_12_375332_g395_i0_p3_GENE_NODE_491_length_7964_cov_12_375332_g395_i0NODE_491_length_7964_cov_12_375332_g395_i0_p3_ORF_typecomplete_len466_score78_36_NODE_491_length_7964_cov_12_375332_g395_i039785375